jgi:hypothetical protein
VPLTRVSDVTGARRWGGRKRARPVLVPEEHRTSFTLISRPARCPSDDGLMFAVNASTACRPPLCLSGKSDARARVGTGPEGRRCSSSDARVGYRIPECASGAVPVLPRARPRRVGHKPSTGIPPAAARASRATAHMNPASSRSIAASSSRRATRTRRGSPSVVTDMRRGPPSGGPASGACLPEPPREGRGGGRGEQRSRRVEPRPVRAGADSASTANCHKDNREAREVSRKSLTGRSEQKARKPPRGLPEA